LVSLPYSFQSLFHNILPPLKRPNWLWCPTNLLFRIYRGFFPRG